VTEALSGSTRRARTVTMALAVLLAGVLGAIGIAAARSQTAGQHGGQAAGAQPGGAQPGGAQPGLRPAGPAGPDTAVPDTAVPDTAGPGTGGPLVTGALDSAKPAPTATPVRAGVPAASARPPAAAPVPPAAPSALTATAGDGKATLCWAAGPRATGYAVYQRDATAGEAWQRLPYPVPGPCWTGGLLINGHTYQYRLRGGNLAGESGFSNTASVTPAGTKPGPAAGLTATAGNGQATLCWRAGSHATGYAVYVRDRSAGTAWTRLPYPVAGPCWTAGLLVNGHRYAFTLRSGNAYGESGNSNTAEVTPHA
jgi:hypothetical protein